MGASGYGPFDNDDAMDFLDELAEARKPDKKLVKAMDKVLQSKKYVEAPDMSTAVASAVLVTASRRGVPLGDELAEETLNDLDLRPDDTTLRRAAQIFVRAFDSRDNEWHELWDEAEALDAVRAELQPFITAATG